MTGRVMALVMVVTFLASASLHAQTKNGFELNGALVPPGEIFHGGPPKDGIPAIDAPKFVHAAEVGFIEATARVLGIERNGVAKAYPIAILNWHEIVNDELGGEPVVVSFCPLCGTGVAFSAVAAGQARSFGVSGLLYNSDVLLYDRQSQSLWSQLLAKAVAGPLKGTQLRLIPLVHTTWGEWRRAHPNTLVLSTDTGYVRDYDRDPYAGYVDSNGLFFPITRRDPRYHPKERVLGIEVGGVHKAYPFAELARTGGTVVDYVGAAQVTVSFDAASQTARIFDEAKRELPGIVAFWFAWYAFHPDTQVFKAP